MKGIHSVRIRAIDDRGSYQINQNTDAANPMDAIDAVIERFGITDSALIFVHAEPLKKEATDAAV